MDLFLHFKIIENIHQFDLPIEFEGITSFDFDNFSSPEVVNTAVNAIDQSDKLLVFIERVEGDDLGSLFKLVRALQNYDKPMCIYYSNPNPFMCSLLEKIGAVKLEQPITPEHLNIFFSQS